MSIRLGDYVNSQCLRCKRIVSALSVVLAGCNLSLVSQTAAVQAATITAIDGDALAILDTA
jgi:hypothetical protein